jgi:hypothetical protein
MRTLLRGLFEMLAMSYVSLADATPHPVFEELGFESFEEHPRADYYPTDTICTMLIPTLG